MYRLLLPLLLSVSTTAQIPGWYMVQLPDSQYYTYDQTWQHNVYHFWNMTYQLRFWNPQAKFVAHVGDLTQEGKNSEFERGITCMGLLHPNQPPPFGIPMGIAIGNHDYNDYTGRASMGTWPWPDSRFRSWVGNPTQGKLFQTPEGAVLALMLEYTADDDDIELARGILEQHRGTPTILVTHDFLIPIRPYQAGGSFTQGELTNQYTDLNGAGRNSPLAIYQKLIEPYPQVFLTLNGHAHSIVRDTRTTPFGRQVQMHQFNVQGDPNGGSGYLRLMHFQDRLLNLYTFSTSIPTGPYSNYVPREDLTRLVMQKSVAEIRQELQARPDVHLYPTQDCYVYGFWSGNSVTGGMDIIKISRGIAGEVGLLQFDIAGTPPVNQALLTVTVEGDSRAGGDGFTAHRMLKPWSENQSWNAMGGLTPGTDYVVAPDGRLGPTGKGTKHLDVTPSVQAWQQGQPNYGWVLLGGSDDTVIRSSEYALTEQPMLTIR